MSEYTCFLHPHHKSTALTDRCPICGEQYDFPLTKRPKQINGKEVERPLHRGFYGAVFKTKHPRIPGKFFAVKVIPLKTYAPKEKGGYGKDFEQEAALHSELSALDIVPALADKGQTQLQFGRFSIDCYFLEMDYVHGPTLDDIIREAPSSTQQLAQIAWDLCDLLEAFEQRGIKHNDLHGKNIIVTNLPQELARRQAIDPLVRLKVLDLGSAAGKSKSGAGRLGDMRWVCEHIIALVNGFEKKHQPPDPNEAKICSRIRQQAEYLGANRDYRLPKARDLKSRLSAAHMFVARPWKQDPRLENMSEHYNAQTLPSWFAPVLLYDPHSWAKKLTGPGPQLLIGMRGCGKTILLKSLEWAARLYKSDDQDISVVCDRVAKETWLGVFASCAALHMSPSSDRLLFPLQRLFLAYCLEVLRDMQMCEYYKVGNVNFKGLDQLADLIRAHIPWLVFEAPQDDLVRLEVAILNALQDYPKKEKRLEFNPRAVFDELARVTRQLVDLWEGKRLILLLDDVSVRYLPKKNVRDLLSQLCLQSTEFAIKISTETQTLPLQTPGGQKARLGRDFQIFDLGAEVFSILRSESGVAFIEQILYQRAHITDGLQPQHPGQVLGHQELTTLAATIKRSTSSAPVYWGIETLAGICVGDLGDVLKLYDEMVGHYHSNQQISKETQHRILVEHCEQALRGLAAQNGWLYAHAVAFATGSFQELVASDGGRLRQTTELFVKISPKEIEAIRQLLELVEAGLFVFSGAAERSKGKKVLPYIQHKLAFRKIFGLSTRMPLAARDRFELAHKRLLAWLKKPSAEAIRPKKRQSGKSRRKQPSAKTKNEQERHQAEPIAAPFTRSESEDRNQLSLFQPIAIGKRKIKEDFPSLRVLHTVSSEYSGPLSKSPLNWRDAHVIAALGFEQRSLGAWRHLLKYGTPHSATLLQYKNIGLASEILALLNQYNVQHKRVKTNIFTGRKSAERLITGENADHLVIDITSLTKPLIYSLVSTALIQKGEVWILHTCAEEYVPHDSELPPIAELIRKNSFVEAFRQIDGMIKGEEGPYTIVTVDAHLRDPNRPSVLAAFVPLKHKRLAALLEKKKFEKVLAIAPSHGLKDWKTRDFVAKSIAESFVERYGGEILGCKTMDYARSFRLLANLHKEYVLSKSCNFEIALTGSKMQAVGAAMFASTASASAVYYCRPEKVDPLNFTAGTADTKLIKLVRRVAES